jgi:hypothetical protein
MAGDLSGPPWVLKCLPCSGKPAEQAVAIDVKRDGGEVVFTLSGFMGNRFNEYRQIMMQNGARYDGKGNRTKLDKTLHCIADLQKAAFTLRIAPDVGASLQALAAATKDAVVNASARAEKVDADLRARGLTLFPFQKIGVEWLAGRMRALLNDDMGLGKTIQTLIALPDGAPVLVVGPEAAKGVWKDETAKWRPDLKCVVLKGKKEFRWPQAGEIVVLTYGSLPELLTEIGTPGEGTVIVADEAHKLKSAKTQRTQRFRRISEASRAHAGRVWLLTATPILNRPQELWTILQSAGLAHDAFRSYEEFKHLFSASQDSWGKITWGDPLPEVPERIQRVSLRRIKKEVLTELPEKMFREIPVEISPEDTKALDKLAAILTKQTPSVWDWLRAGAAAYEGEPQAADAARVSAEEVAKARQALKDNTGLGFEQLARCRELLAKAKIPAVLEMVEDFEEQEEPLVVFSAHRAPIDTLGNRPGWAAITGDQSGEERQQIARDFQAGKYKGVALTIEAGGTALTLTRAAHVLFVDRTFTPKLNEQAEDRTVRIGQTRGVLITDLVADHPIDIRLAEILAAKTRIINKSIEAAGIGATARPVMAEVPTVDFDAIAAKAKRDEEEAQKATEEAKKVAEQRAAEATERKAKAKKEEEERKEREKKEKREKKARERAKAKGWIEDEDHPERRAAETAQEKWAEQGLTLLASLDPDFAMAKNEVGFNKSDGSIGHWLSQELPRGLTPRQWALAIKLCRPYYRQIGECPK